MYNQATGALQATLIEGCSNTPRGIPIVNIGLVLTGPRKLWIATWSLWCLGFMPSEKFGMINQISEKVTFNIARDVDRKPLVYCEDCMWCILWSEAGNINFIHDFSCRFCSGWGWDDTIWKILRGERGWFAHRDDSSPLFILKIICSIVVQQSCFETPSVGNYFQWCSHVLLCSYWVIFGDTAIWISSMFGNMATVELIYDVLYDVPPIHVNEIIVAHSDYSFVSRVFISAYL